MELSFALGKRKCLPTNKVFKNKSRTNDSKGGILEHRFLKLVLMRILAGFLIALSWIFVPKVAYAKTFLFYIVADGPHLERETLFLEHLERIFKRSKNDHALIWFDPFQRAQKAKELIYVQGRRESTLFMSEPNMGDQAHFEAFLTRAISLGLPLKEVHLILSGHGRGPFGFGYDYQGYLKPQFGNYDSLSLKEIQKSVRKFLDQIPGKSQLDSIFYLGCLMANLIWIDGHHGLTRYLIAHPGLDQNIDLARLVKKNRIDWSYFYQSVFNFRSLLEKTNPTLVEFLKNLRESDLDYEIFSMKHWRSTLGTLKNWISDQGENRTLKKRIHQSPFRDPLLSLYDLVPSIRGDSGASAKNLIESISRLTGRKEGSFNLFWPTSDERRKQIFRVPGKQLNEKIQELLNSKVYLKTGLNFYWKNRWESEARVLEPNVSWDEYLNRGFDD